MRHLFAPLVASLLAVPALAQDRTVDPFAPTQAALRPVAGGGGPSAGNLILPVAYAARWGELANADPFGTGRMRYQQVHLGTEIGAITPMFGIGFREDDGLSASGGVAQLVIKMGLTSFDHNTIGLASSFDANFDSGPSTTVVNGNVNLPSLPGTNTTFSNFAVTIPFNAPWIYVPQAGKHLLFEVVNANSTNTGFYDKVHQNRTLGTCTRIFAFTADATNAANGFRNEGLVVCFHTAPVCSPATFATLGSGCFGSNGMPQHSASGVPRLGGSYSLLLSGARPNVPAWLILDTQRSSWGSIPLPLDLTGFGAPGCTLEVPASNVLAVAVNGAGVATLPVPVPNVSTYCGLHVYTQFVIADVVNQLGVVLSNAGDSRLGS